jgi:hypothetical protein
MDRKNTAAVSREDEEDGVPREEKPHLLPTGDEKRERTSATATTTERTSKSAVLRLAFNKRGRPLTLTKNAALGTSASTTGTRPRSRRTDDEVDSDDVCDTKHKPYSFEVFISLLGERTSCYSSRKFTSTVGDGIDASLAAGHSPFPIVL